MNIGRPIVFFAALLVGSPAVASDLCELRFLADYTPEWSDEPVAKEGEQVGPVTQYWIDEDGSRYCVKGGYCYPTSVDGQPLTVLHNCIVDVSLVELTSTDPREILFGLKLVRTAVDAGQLRIDDVELTLGQMGLSVVGADNAAVAYVRRPQSYCASLVQSALEGNTEARATLVAGVDDCHSQAEEVFSERRAQ